MLIPHQTPLSALSRFLSKLNVVLAHFFLGRCGGGGVAGVALVGVGVAVCVPIAVAAAASSARSSPVVDVEILFLPLAETDGVDVRFVVFLRVRWSEGCCRR